MFDLDDLIVRCQGALAETEPRRAIREVLERTVAVPNDVADVLAPTEAGFSILHHAPDLTILHVVWAPKMTIYPHNHLMWAAIGIYTGQEDNAFYRRSAPRRPHHCHWPPGHSVRVVNDAEVIFFSPQVEHTEVMNHMIATMAG